MSKSFILIIATLFCFSKQTKSQNALLQNFANPALYNVNDSTCINISGDWQGEETEYYDANGTYKGKFGMRFILQQQGNKVFGLTYINCDNGQSTGTLKIRGMVSGNTFSFEEYEIVEQAFVNPGVTWCLRTGQLNIKTNGNKLVLEGNNYKGYAAYFYFECSNFISMQLSKPAETEVVKQTETIINKKSRQEMKLQPNPAFNTVTVKFKIDTGSDVRIDMYDLSGGFIETITNGNFEAGTHLKEFSLSNYAAGVYLVRMLCKGQICSSMLVVSK